ncbi:3'-5' exonuclease family protein [Flexibacter flexilis]|nr:exonuclease domain-containing protein [Flexibacter flexilis]
MANNTLMYAIIDIETTGGQPTQDRITEIAVVIHDGEKIVEEYSTLVNPCRSIPYQITQLTGISNEMVRDAPKFYEVAKKIVELTENKIFVAHNVRFDYSFIKKEFNDLGYNYSRKTLCTVRLSRKILAGLPSYSLGRLCESLQIPMTARHRALGDAMATAHLFTLLLQNDAQDTIQKTVADEVKAALLPPSLNRQQISELPELAGVYYFHDAEGRVIYVGKSKSIRKRVLSHFAVDLKSKKAIEFKNNIADITYETTGNELVALLYESHLIKKIKPLYNRAQRRSNFSYGIYDYEDGNGYINFVVEKVRTGQTPLLYLSNADAGKNTLFNMVQQYQLCQKYCGLYKTQGACFDHQIKVCAGACVQKESPESYNERAQKAIKRFRYAHNNFFILGAGRQQYEQSVVWVENGVYKGFGFVDTSTGGTHEDLKNAVKPYADNRDVQQIIRSYMKTMRTEKLIVY